MGLRDIFSRKREASAPELPAVPARQTRAAGRLPSAGHSPLGRAALRLFDAASSDRLTLDWTTHPMSADEVIQRHQRVLVARSRQQAASNDYAKAFIRMCRQNIVGPQGVMLQAQSRDDKGRLDTLANQAIEAAGDWGFALQVLDPQRCPVQLDEDDLPGGRFIRSGIEFNRFGRPLAYLFAHEDRYAPYSYSFSGRDYLRVPADEIVHGFLPEMTGQKRGLPWMATGLFRLKQLNGFEDAALVNARVGASKMGFLQWRDGQGPEYDEDEQKHFHMEVQPGEFGVLPDGAELKDWQPQFPSGDFAVFNKAMLRGIAAGFGVLYNNLANDLEHVNFSSIRQGTLDEREHWKEMQQWLIESLIEPVFGAWLPRALLAGRITVKGRPLKAERLARYAVVSWQPRRWAWIDPRADIEAAIAAKNQMLLSPSQIIREQGRDPSDVWAEIAADIEQMRAAGIPDEFVKAAILDKNLQATVMAEAAKTQTQGQDE